jgi:hypothetical protein
MSVRIESDDGKRVLLKSLKSLTPLMETAFSKAIRGATWDSVFGCYIASWEVLPSIIKRLRQDKFAIELSPSVASAVEGNVGILKKSVEQAVQRVKDNAEHLYPYQRTGAIKLASRRCYLLADDMGLGKTRQAIFAVPDRSPVVVVAPASVKGVWRNEFRKLRPEFTVNICEGRKGENAFRWPREREVIVVNPDIMPPPVLGHCAFGDCRRQRRFGKTTCGKHRKEYPYVDANLCIYCGRNRHVGMDCLELEIGSAPGGMVVIPDEAHLYKDPKSKRTMSLRAILNVARARGGFNWPLTGTPLLNEPSELWTILENVDLAASAFYSKDNFIEIMGGKRDHWGGIVYPEYNETTRPIPKEAVEHLSSVMLRRHKDDELNMPSKTYVDIPVSLSAVLRREVDEFIKDAAIDVNDDRFIDKVPFNETMRIRKLIATAKIPYMEDWVALHEEEEPLIIFTAHRGPCERFLGRKGWGVVYGDTKVPERFAMAEAFQRGELRGLIGTIDVMGVGLTLTRARHMFFNDFEWSPMLQWQAEDRFRRIGQERPVWIHRLIADHVLERRLAEILRRKTSLHNMTVGSVTIDSDVDIAELNMEGITVDRGVDVLKPIDAVASKVVRRAPKTAIELWAFNGLKQLSNDDKDRAKKRNGVGFMRIHTEQGNSLAVQLEATGGLSDLQWRAAVNIAKNYWRQIGPMPK